jgi:hypothetical protein
MFIMFYLGGRTPARDDRARRNPRCRDDNVMRGSGVTPPMAEPGTRNLPRKRLPSSLPQIRYPARI